MQSDFLGRDSLFIVDIRRKGLSSYQAEGRITSMLIFTVRKNFITKENTIIGFGFLCMLI